MSAATIEIHEAVAAAWIAWGLDDLFKSYWSDADKLTYPTLNENEATPGQPHPYCVYEMPANVVENRMTGRVHNQQLQIRNNPLLFHVFARPFGSGSAKEIAANLADRIMQDFGGHPTAQPKEMTLSNGGVILQQYQDDYSLREGDNEYSWTIEYNIKADVPVRLRG